MTAVVGGLIAGGGAILGGLIGSSASKKAAKQQAEAGRYAADQQLLATRESNQMTKDMYNQGMANQSPFLQGGQTAYSALMGGMGLGGPRAMGGGEGGMGGTNYGATQEEMDAAANSPFKDMFTKTFAPSDLTTDPSYQWRLDQGLRAMKGQQSGRGLLGSSQSMMDLENYGQGAASQEYQSAYNRFMNNQNTAWGRLSGLAGIGSNTAANLGAMGQGAASQYNQNLMAGTGAANNYLTGAAAAGAAGDVGAANAWQSGIGGGINNWMGMQYLNKRFPGQPNNTGIQPYDDIGGTSGGWTGSH